MKIVVQKFGGTSVATPTSRAAVMQKIIACKEKGEMPIVVVSAMGRQGDPYATDTMLGFVNAQAGKPTDREYDMLLACGEIISAVTIATQLQHQGYAAAALTGGQSGIITDNNHTQADLIYGKPDYLKHYVENDIIPVVAGFQGVTVDGEITTLGRGGSDTSASMIASIVGAKRIEIYTDVDGIMTADPRVCEKTRIIPAMSYSEVFQMADSGAKVIHPRAVEYAMHANIPLTIKNTFSEAPGTCIQQTVRHLTEQAPPNVITGIAHRPNRTQVCIEQSINFQDTLFEKIAEQAISIDLINVLPSCKLFTIDTCDEGKLAELLQQNDYQYSMRNACCKVTVIGERMTGVPGVMARIIKALNQAGVKVLQTADSLTTIACLIEESCLSQAVTALHEEFDL